MKSKIVFFSVRDNTAKLSAITKIAHRHFDRKEPVLFLVPDQNALEFLDRLLWAHPIDSFLPHPSSLIQIQLDFDPAFSTLFNLCPQPFLNEKVKTIYELEDHTSPEKLQLSDKRYQTYKSLSLQISVEF